jgi:hypothetical protein
MRSRIAALIAILAAAGCATAPLTQGGARVRAVLPDQTSRCRLLGPVEGSHANGASVQENEAFATDDVRNQVAKLGGNAFAVTRRTSSMWRSVVAADAYQCPDWEPVPGLAPQ